ncbi:hypothetical protein KC726_00890 [Candidatus Woesebacteria bacterium]|nr:hypothetical protein [Candidatus Woesebacteria bacterium]
MKNISKQQLVIIGGVILVLFIIGFFIRSKSNSANNKSADETVFETPAEIIPTVDSSVIVTIDGKTEAVIAIDNIPEGTETIEYELSYNTTSGSIEGLFGSIDTKGESSVEEDITFGTCSSGVCRYHSIDGDVSGVFKFSGSYGERILEQTFTL